MRRGLIAFALLLALAGGLFADNSSDDTDQIFQAPPPDTQTPQPDQPNPVDQFTTQTGIKFRGSFDSYAGFLLGWVQPPDLGNLANGFYKSPAFALASSLTFEARPNASFRVLGTLIENYPNTSSGVVTYTDVTLPLSLSCSAIIQSRIFFFSGLGSRSSPGGPRGFSRLTTFLPGFRFPPRWARKASTTPRLLRSR